MFCHNKPLFRARSKGLGRLAHSVYSYRIYYLHKSIRVEKCTLAIGIVDRISNKRLALEKGINQPKAVHKKTSCRWFFFF